MDSFKASAQYDDFKGTAAADEADGEKLAEYLEKKGLKRPDQFILASSLYVGESHNGQLGMVTVTAYLFDAPDHVSVKTALDATADPIAVQKVDVNVSLQEYLAFFKRFSVMLTKKGFDLNDREYEEI